MSIQYWHSNANTNKTVRLLLVTKPNYAQKVIEFSGEKLIAKLWECNTTLAADKFVQCPLQSVQKYAISKRSKVNAIS